ncbi:MAG: nickel pincer cofactor biosynthesis protein LarC [Candidatus Lokiarchaeota archaeon]|nr:nickel pincer cofactor biosynthesis protein LarC [Candidatus Lokiarchaeota archaeon]
MRILYLDLNNSGISGDMFLASLLGLVSNPNEILEELTELKNYLPGVSKLNIELMKILRSGIETNQLKIEITEKKDHRSATTLRNSLNAYLNDKKISDSAKNYADKVLNSLIQAEAEVHGELAENIHLHELSSVDTLIDILGVTVILDAINGFDDMFKIYCSKIPLGGGKVKTAHGMLTVPAPATLKILEKSSLLTYGGPIESEIVTPTGAALLTNLNPKITQFLPEMEIKKTIYSTGQKSFKNFLNIFRLYYGNAFDTDSVDSFHPLQKYVEDISILETDVDDVSGEILGDFINKLKKEEILDVQIIPSITKKNRPSYIIKVLCHPKNTFGLIEKLIHELGTLGVRYYTMNRVCIERTQEKRNVEINGKNYEVNFKISFIKTLNNKDIVNIKPEYEDIKKISEDSGIPVRKIQIRLQGYLNPDFMKK